MKQLVLLAAALVASPVAAADPAGDALAARVERVLSRTPVIPRHKHD